MSLHSCSKGLLATDQSAVLHQCFGNKVVSYPNILQQSRYCLIVHELRYGTHQLLDAMMSVSDQVMLRFYPQFVILYVCLNCVLL